MKLLALILAPTFLASALADTEAEQRALAEAKAELAAEIKALPKLPVTAEEAVIKANATAKARGADLRFTKMDFKTGGPRYSVGDPEIGVLAFVQPSEGKPTSAMFIAKLEGNDAMNIMAAMLLVFRGVDPALTQERAREISLLFGKVVVGKKLEADGVACRYSALISPTVGFLVTVEPLVKK